MKLTPKQMNHASKWLMERAGGLTCLECNGEKPICWDHFHALPRLSNPKEGKSAGARFAVVIECTDCGCLRIFSARAMGFASKAEPKVRSAPLKKLH